MAPTIRRLTVGLVTALAAMTLVPAPMSAADPDDATDAPRSAVAVALAHVRANAADLGVGAADVAELRVATAYRSAHNGVTHVNLNQRYAGLEVFGAYVTVNVASDRRVVFAAGNLKDGLRLAGPGLPAFGPRAAVEAASASLDLAAPTGLRVLRGPDGASRETLVSAGGISEAPIPVRLGWAPTSAGLRLAWQAVIDDAASSHLWAATVDATTGALLDAQDWTIHDPMEELSHTLARSGGSATASAVRAPETVADGSSYRVLDVPKESPNDGSISLVTTPADALASPFGWHDTDGAAGPEFTITRGNNVHAYFDQDNNNAADAGADANGGPGLTFDFPADVGEHAQNYRDALVTNLFYMNNVIHDVLYRYGFDEVSGNFQQNKYGATLATGGAVPGGDYVRAEAADGGGTNNANFSTPANYGGTPRMQMYLWPGNQFGSQNQVVVDGIGSFGGSWARFSLAPTVAGTSGAIVDAGTGCTASSYAGAPAGTWIAIVTGGNSGCQNIDKARTAAAAGAAALIVAHNATGAAPVLTGSLTTPGPRIPVVSITQADGNAIRAAVATGSTTGTVRKHPDHPGIRDGDFENGIIIHEYGHGVSNRLTGGPGVNCLTGDEQMGEGWSDYLAISMLLDPALDDPELARGMGPYALFQADRNGNGIRPRPYSRNMQIQPATYDSIKTAGWLNGGSVSAPHGIGHVWAAFLWDMTWDLIDKHGFNPNIYEAWDTGGNNRAIQYVMDGMKFQGCAPGFVTGRDAIIAAADVLSDGEDTCTVWASFARRGLGFSAIQGASASRNDNIEAFDTHPNCLAPFAPPVNNPPLGINSATAGATVHLPFTVDGARGKAGVLAENSPFSRQVDCVTRMVPSEEPPNITPRARPVTAGPGKARLKKLDHGRYEYEWRTDAAWAGTCREFVLTRGDGVQHRAFFEFGVI
jgi:extracellular elastinolytic metalloproteinase